MADFSIHRLPPSRLVSSGDSVNPAQSPAKANQPGDRVEISSEAMAMYQAEQGMQLVRDTPDIRVEKVNRIMEEIEQQGDAWFDRVSDNQLAEAILSNPFSEFYSPVKSSRTE